VRRSFIALADGQLHRDASCPIVSEALERGIHPKEVVAADAPNFTYCDCAKNDLWLFHSDGIQFDGADATAKTVRAGDWKMLLEQLRSAFSQIDGLRRQVRELSERRRH